MTLLSPSPLRAPGGLPLAPDGRLSSSVATRPRVGEDRSLGIPRTPPDAPPLDRPYPLRATIALVWGTLDRARRALAPLSVTCLLACSQLHHDRIDLIRPGATPPTLPVAARVDSDRTYKLDLIAAMDTPPRLLIFGGSRAQRFDPQYFEEVTGLVTFNAAFSNGRPSDAWAITRYCLQRRPKVKLRVFWAVQPSVFQDKPLDPGIVQDQRLSRAFDQRTVDEAAREQIAAAGSDRPSLWTRPGYAADGRLIYNYYDYLEEQGRTLDTAIRQWVSLMQSRQGTTPFKRTTWSPNQLYFARTLALLNSIGVRPVVVVMPTHPLAIELLGEARWTKQQTRLHEALAELATRHDFALLDYSRIEAFGGDPSDFYDGVHVKSENARRIVDAAWRDAADAFR